MVLYPTFQTSSPTAEHRSTIDSAQENSVVLLRYEFLHFLTSVLESVCEHVKVGYLSNMMK